MPNCMVPLASVKTGVVICIFVLLALSPKMYFARALKAPSPLPAGLPSSLLPELDASIFVSATSTLSYLHGQICCFICGVACMHFLMHCAPAALHHVLA